MSLTAEVFAPLLQFLAGQDAAAAKEAWPKGPTVPYRTVRGVPIVRYAGWIQRMESSALLNKETPAQIAQRLRRLYFSEYTEAFKPVVGRHADMVIQSRQELTPLTTEHVDIDTLNGLFGTSTVMTARGIEVDVGHLWMAIDLALSGESPAGVAAQVYVDSEYEALFSWSGDLGAVANTWSQEALRLSEPDREQALIDQIRNRAARDDLLGDLDGVVLARYWSSEEYAPDPLVISADLLKYYEDDAMPQAEARNLPYPNSARRFHYFLADSSPSLPADGKYSTPLEVTIDEQRVAEALNVIINDAADDLVGLAYSSSTLINKAGRAHYEKYCLNFAKFLKEGLASGMAEWPQDPW